MPNKLFIKFENPAFPASRNMPGLNGDIEIQTWTLSSTQPAPPSRSSNGAGTAPQASHAGVAITKSVDRSTSEVLRAIWNGDQFGRATITCFRSDGRGGSPVLYLTVAMENVLISAHQLGAATSDDGAVESVMLDYASIRYTYADERAGDSVSAQHDLTSRNVK
jgi:type VI secretion system Hcp family effector